LRRSRSSRSNCCRRGEADEGRLPRPDPCDQGDHRPTGLPHRQRHPGSDRGAAQNRTAAETTRIFRREVLPTWGGRTVAEVTKRDVIALLDRIRERGSPIMANRVLAAVRKFFNWCLSRGIVERSVCEGISAPARETARHRTLSDEELATCSGRRAKPMRGSCPTRGSA
jgi:hypothetical protein